MSEQNSPEPAAAPEEIQQLRERLRKAEETLCETRRREEELERSNREKDQFIATMAHELRNPLAPILNSVHALRLRGADDATAVKRALGMIERQARHMARLIDNLLDVSRLARGQIQLRKTTQDLVPILHRAVESCRPMLDAGKFEVSIDLPDEPLRLEADTARLEQVLANLLTNAAQYSKPGERIRVGAARVGDEVVLHVRDMGLGIAGNQLMKIFEPFFQIDRTAERAQSGLGLGLTLAKGLIELHGGAIEARSEGIGMGSDFVVRLPLLVQPEADETAGPAPSEPEQRPLRVLIVEDNLDSAASLSEVLALWGCTTLVANDGVEAVKKALEAHPDIILLDIGLPNMNGYQVAKLLRQRADMDSTKIVAITGYGQPKDKERSQFVGIDHHLTKPVDFNMLKELIMEHAGR